MSDRIQLGSDGCWVLAPVPVDDGDPQAPISPPPGLTMTLEAPERHTVTLFDSWEWSLWHDGFALVGDGHQLRLTSIHPTGGGPSDRTIPMPSPPRWAHEQPVGPLAEVLAPRLGLRAAIPVAHLGCQRRRWAVRNADDKVVARLEERVWAENIRTLSVAPMRGYDEEAALICGLLGRHGYSDQPPLVHALAAAEIAPRRWTNKPAFTFDGRTPARFAVIEMVRTMVELARQTEGGIIDDTDTEFLHDYRVLLRKARSVVSLTKGALDPETTDALKSTIRELTRQTNALRDLDVHLLEAPAQTLRVPERLRDGLNALHTDLARRRTKTHRGLAAALKSEEYARAIDSLEARLAAAEDGPKGRRPIRKIAERKLALQLARVRAQGRAIGPETPDEAVHALRIEGKKLRYLLEFFRHLYLSEEVTVLLKALKRMQDILGTFNDRSVQQTVLYDWLEKTKNVSRPAAASIGALITALAAEQVAARSQVEQVFASLDATELRRVHTKESA